MKLAKRAAAAVLAALLLAGCAGAPAQSGTDASGASQSASQPAEPTPEPHEASTEMPLPAEGISALTGRAAEHPGRRPVAVMCPMTRPPGPSGALAPQTFSSRPTPAARTPA